MSKSVIFHRIFNTPHDFQNVGLLYTILLLQPGIAFIECAKYLLAGILSDIFTVCGDFLVQELLSRNVWARSTMASGPPFGRN